MTTIVGFLKAKKLVLVYTIAATFVVGLAYKTYNAIFDLGYNKRTSEYTEAYNLEIKKQQDLYDEKLKQTISVMETENKAALDRKDSKAEVIVKTQKVIQYVDKIVVKNECSDLATDVVWMLSESTSTINNEAKRATKTQYKF